jgi:hypothetical protein
VQPWSIRRAFPQRRGNVDPRQDVNVSFAGTAVAFGFISCFEHQVWPAFALVAFAALGSVWTTPPWCDSCARLARPIVDRIPSEIPAWAGRCGRCDAPIPRRLQGPPLAALDLVRLVVTLGVTATLGYLVHPLFWGLSLVAIAWWLGHDTVNTRAEAGHESGRQPHPNAPEV